MSSGYKAITTAFVIIVFLFTLVSSLLITYNLQSRKTLKTNAQTVLCNNPAGCGGNCDPSRNMGCGTGGCRFWEYCADENHDLIYSCYDTTALGIKEPDYSKACGHARTAPQNNPTPTTQQAQPKNPSQVPSLVPSQYPSPTSLQTPTKTPNAPISCNDPKGCGGTCNPNIHRGCGYGGCRFWEQCADDNGDGVFSCYDRTDGQDYYQMNPKPQNVCFNTLQTEQPSPTPTTTIDPFISATPSYTPTPTVAQIAPSPTSVPDLGLDLSKLCIPLEINGNQADKLDMLIIPIGYTQGERQSMFYNLAVKAKDSLKYTNLQQYPNETINKMNWYLLNVDHSDFAFKSNVDQLVGLDDKLIEGSAFRLGNSAQYCGRDRFMILVKSRRNAGVAYRGMGGVIYEGGVTVDNAKVFAHEWGHVVGDLEDEYLHSRNAIGPNCSDTGNGLAQSYPDPCPEDPQIKRRHRCTSEANNQAFTQPCPQWDCSKITCSPLAQNLLKNAGCYPRCAEAYSYRAAANSIMSNLEDNGKDDFSGPSLVNIIERVFARYR